MAADNDSSGLKIAVAAFITLAVILAVSCYFLYSSYTMANAQLAAAHNELDRARSAQQALQKQNADLRAKVAAESPAGDTTRQANETAKPR